MRTSRVSALGLLLIVGLVTTGARGATDQPGLGARGAPDALGGRAAQQAPSAAGAQEAEVTGLVLDPRSRQPVVLLQGKRDKRELAMTIGPFEANGIALPLQGVSPPRPLTHDLLLNILGDLKASLRRVVITDLKDDVYYAQLQLDVQGQVLHVDSRPSDAIALALRAKVPILVEDRVFEKSERLAPQPAPSPHF